MRGPCCMHLGIRKVCCPPEGSEQGHASLKCCFGQGLNTLDGSTSEAAQPVREQSQRHAASLPTLSTLAKVTILLRLQQPPFHHCLSCRKNARSAQTLSSLPPERVTGVEAQSAASERATPFCVSDSSLLHRHLHLHRASPWKTRQDSSIFIGNESISR